MRSLSWWLVVAAMGAALIVFGRATPVLAAEQDRGGPAERLERLEGRVNEMAERQEQFMRRMGAALEERRGPMGAPIQEKIRRQRMLREGAGGGGPMARAAAPQIAGGPAPVGAPVPTAKSLEDILGMMRLCFLVGLIFNILIAIWIFFDIRKRGEGSGIFVALALLAGIPTAIIYAIVRIGDKKI